jgi:hypothetical protein
MRRLQSFDMHHGGELLRPWVPPIRDCQHSTYKDGTGRDERREGFAHLPAGRSSCPAAKQWPARRRWSRRLQGPIAAVSCKAVRGKKPMLIRLEKSRAQRDRGMCDPPARHQLDLDAVIAGTDRDLAEAARRRRESRDAVS